MIKCALLRQQRLGTNPRVDPPALLKFAAGARFKSVASEVYAHPWSASSSESRALLSDAEPDSDCPKARTPKAPQPSRPCRSTGSAQTGAQLPFCSIPA